MTDYSFMKSGFDNLESEDDTLENVGEYCDGFYGKCNKEC